jgi:hypothetical protein
MMRPTEEKPESGTTNVMSPAVETPRATRQSRLTQALVWVGVVAGGVFVVGAIFFSGFFLSWSSDDRGGGHGGSETMACCSHMKPGEPMGQSAPMGPGGPRTPGAQRGPAGPMTPGEMMPGKMMSPGMMDPHTQSPAIAPPSSPRP